MQLPQYLAAAAVWLTNHPDVAGALVTLLTGTLAGAHHYRRTGTLPLHTLPWRALRRLFFEFRRRWFAVPKPGGDYFAVDDGLDGIRERLGTESYNPNWGLSYYYKGEDLNARRYYYAPGATHPHRQIHIRGWEGDQVELKAHDEPAPEHHPKAHLRGDDLHDATSWLRRTWSSHNLDPRGYGSDGGSA